MLTRVLIANRGEIAVRIARTCRTMGIGTVAVFSDVDRGALHVEMCDEAVRLGGASPAESYLDAAGLIDAAERSGADAIHPGYGFLSESATFARAVLDAGLVWVGPPPPAMEAMGDKLTAKATMADAGVPLIPGEGVSDASDLPVVGDRVGYPLMVKAAAGGGGKGMRVVRDPDDLEDAVAAGRREAGSAFGDDRVFLERLITAPRHVEVQVLADTHGNVVHLFERECSIQRRHQKVIEESPSPGIDEAVREAMCDAAVAAARAIGYVGAGTVEFIVDDAAQRRRAGGDHVAATEAFAFLEMNTRLQVEHPVTEESLRVETAGSEQRLDLVRLQLLVAAGQPLPFGQEQVRRHGHAIEARVYAEDPDRDYLPSPGTLRTVRWEASPGIRVDAGVRSGDEVSPHYDPMLAKVIAAAPSRAEATMLLARCLERTVLQGVTTNRGLLAAVLHHPRFAAGETTTDFLDGLSADDGRSTDAERGSVELGLLAATVTIARRGPRWPPAVPVGFSPTLSVRHRMTLEARGRQHEVAYRQLDGSRWALALDGGDEEVLSVCGDTAGGLEIERAGRRRRVAVHGEAPELSVVLPDGQLRIGVVPRFPEVGPLTGEGVTLSPMPGSVVAVAVGEGDEVAAGDLLVTVEAMKMEHQVTAPFAGRVSEVRVAAGQQVAADEVLVVVEDPGDPGADRAG